MNDETLNNAGYTIDVVPVSHYCAASWNADHLTRWMATRYSYENGYADEVTQCPACGATVAYRDDEHD
jgi:hypothetical protein